MRRAACVAVALLLVPLLTATAFASTGDDGGLWDVFSGIVEAIGNAVKSVGEFISKAVNNILDGLKYLFIPRQDFFPKMQKRLQDSFGAKFGGILGTIRYLQNRFASMRAYPGLDGLLTLKFPQGHLIGGVEVNLIRDVPEVIAMIRGAFSGFLSLATVAYAYKKVTALLNT